MKLLKLCTGQLRLGEPLPWNVRMAGGELLLSKGHLISEARQLEALLERGVYVDEEELQRHRVKVDDEGATGGDPFSVWGDMARKANLLLRNPALHGPFEGEVRQLAQRVQASAEDHPDVGSFELAHLTGMDYPVRHSLHTAYLATLVGLRLGLGPDERRTAVCAGLTMNLSMLPLQAALCTQREPPTAAQREQIRQHPQRGAELLAQHGVQDKDWLDAVRQHHERDDGTGYPEGRREVHPLARLIGRCDVYLAKFGSRASRAALSAPQAARDFFAQCGGQHDAVTAAVIKESGLYPPGTYVKLASGELAVVVRRGPCATAPQVCSLADATGMAFTQPLVRDTSRLQHKVLAAVPAGSVRVRFERERLFALVR
jgi:hypothetical protein